MLTQNGVLEEVKGEEWAEATVKETDTGVSVWERVARAALGLCPQWELEERTSPH